MIIGNPLHGTLHPASWARPSGNLDFEVTQVFGCTGFEAELPYLNCAHFHRGIDLWNGHCGGEVIAVASGKVTLAGTDSYSGNAIRVWIETNGWYHGYYHLSKEIVSVGQSISKGQVIGYVGQTGWATACHLHFELHANSDHLSFIDPWPRFAQNVTVKPTGAGINIRSTAGGSIYAVTRADGNIHRVSDNADLGPTNTWRKWGGEVTGSSYTVGGVTSNHWEEMYLDGAYRFVASLLTTRSMT